jgi:hypothetical protein
VSDVRPAEYVLPIEEVACQVAVGPDGLAGAALPPAAKAAIENGEVDTESVELRQVRCSPDQARDLLEYFGHTAATLQVHGDYERSSACAQAAERIRRALEGPVLT